MAKLSAIFCDLPHCRERPAFALYTAGGELVGLYCPYHCGDALRALQTREAASGDTAEPAPSMPPLATR